MKCSVCNFNQSINMPVCLLSIGRLGEFVACPAPLGQRAAEKANVPHNASAHDDPTDAKPGANVGECQTGRPNATNGII